MNLIAELVDLDNLIVKHTSPPATPILRNKIQRILEETEAYVASMTKKDEALAKAEQSGTEKTATIAELATKLEQWQSAPKLKRPGIGGTPPFRSPI